MSRSWIMGLATALVATAAVAAEELRAGGQTGTASFYGAELAGRPTASGVPYDPTALTAAHATLPFGSEVTVIALATGRRVKVEVNDRGPFTADRVIDLSRRAAELLGIVTRGVARVRIIPSVREPRPPAR